MQKIKQVFIAFNSNWHLNMHNKYFVEKTMAKLKMNNHLEENINDNILKEQSKLHVYSCAEEAASTYFLSKPLCIVRLYNYDFGVLHSQNRFWKLHDLTFEKESGYVCLFKLKISSRVQTEVTVNENMITNVCIAIPHGDSYAILDMEWKELDSNKKFVYAYK